MTFAEFQVRLFAYKRIQLREWEKVRFMAWSSTIGSHQDPKKLPKTIEKFMPLGGSNSANKGVSEEQKQNYLNEYKEYLKKINNG
ncbi:hypothetical protein PHG11b_39 [Flavobacterium phage 11b]|uniref:hypothetical protein n=1 Tax=Flavobacterium phage 11b TaxID=294631 RepID=UPI0000444145|nr:hypothetical protein PHG11b_39 [Flavobacterium phage 11b]CAH56666.1 hypothetical protein PHG11b_39 [Flavobacterium phage 11b]